jgi:demethylmenaquinone methyltransferase / 2-methoxy-6-polyprenyl-1,4-benzoquinol methylase
MFNRIARRYDHMNIVMTAGLDRRWRERTAELCGAGPGDRALDVATGTGDLAVALKRRVGPHGHVVGLDFAEQMVDRARLKAPDIEFVVGDALELPFAASSFDVATVGFGVRNFSELEKGLRELTRVVRPGGRIAVLELTYPTGPLMDGFFRLWLDGIIPVVGRHLVAETETYLYFPNSVRRFPRAAAFAGLLWDAGLIRVGWVTTARGLIAIHAGTVPEAS